MIKTKKTTKFRKMLGINSFDIDHMRDVSFFQLENDSFLEFLQKGIRYFFGML
jgi:hypothetical protein